MAFLGVLKESFLFPRGEEVDSSMLLDDMAATVASASSTP